MKTIKFDPDASTISQEQAIEFVAQRIENYDNSAFELRQLLIQYLQPNSELPTEAELNDVDGLFE